MAARWRGYSQHRDCKEDHTLAVRHLDTEVFIGKHYLWMLLKRASGKPDSLNLSIVLAGQLATLGIPVGVSTALSKQVPHNLEKKPAHRRFPNFETILSQIRPFPSQNVPAQFAVHLAKAICTVMTNAPIPPRKKRSPRTLHLVLNNPDDQAVVDEYLSERHATKDARHG
jgi:hypothetical protein